MNAVSVTDKELAAAIAALPPVSPVLQQLLIVLDDPLSDLDDISRLVRTDMALTTRVLRLANSAHFGLPQRVGSIEEAIQHIGVVEVNRLVTSLGGRRFYERSLERYGITADLLWQHTLAVAVGAETIAPRLQADRNVAYVAGMLHAIGFVALERVAEARNLDARTAHVPLLDWEREHFGTDNCGAAARVLRHWRFPEALSAAVAGRYEPPTEETASQPASILHLASCLAEKLHAGLPPEGGLFRLSAARLAPTGLSMEDGAEIEAEVRQSLARTRTLLNLGESEA